MPRNGLPGRRRARLAHAMTATLEAVRAVGRTSVRVVRGPSHIERTLTRTNGPNDVEIGTIQEALPPRTQSRHAATVAPSPLPRRRLVMFGSVNAASSGVADELIGRPARRATIDEWDDGSTNDHA